MGKIYKENPSLAKKVAGSKTEIYEKKCSVCSYWFQIIENYLVHIVADHLINCGILIPHKFGVEYDGLNLPPTSVVFDKEKVINDINALIQLTTGLNIKFKFKDYDDDHILHNIIEARQNIIIDNKVDDTNNEDENVSVVNSSEEDWKKKFKILFPEFEKNIVK